MGGGSNAWVFGKVAFGRRCSPGLLLAGVGRHSGASLDCLPRAGWLTRCRPPPARSRC